MTPGEELNGSASNGNAPILYTEHVDDDSDEAEAILQDLAMAALGIMPVFGSVAVGISQANGNRQLLQETVRRHGIEIQKLLHAFSEDRMSEFVNEATSIASKTRSEEKLSLLASILASGINADVQLLEPHFLLLQLITPLEPVHIEILRQCKLKQEADERNGESMNQGYNSSEIAEANPDIREVADPLIGILLGLRLLENIGQGRHGGIGERERWGVSDSGRWLLGQLADIGSHGTED